MRPIVIAILVLIALNLVFCLVRGGSLIQIGIDADLSFIKPKANELLYFTKKVEVDLKAIREMMEAQANVSKV